jgi:hypothetical protein
MSSRDGVGISGPPVRAEPVGAQERAAWLAPAQRNHKWDRELFFFQAWGKPEAAILQTLRGAASSVRGGMPSPAGDAAGGCGWLAWGAGLYH